MNTCRNAKNGTDTKQHGKNDVTAKVHCCSDLTWFLNHQTKSIASWTNVSSVCKTIRPLHMWDKEYRLTKSSLWHHCCTTIAIHTVWCHKLAPVSSYLLPWWHRFTHDGPTKQQIPWNPPVLVVHYQMAGDQIVGQGLTNWRWQQEKIPVAKTHMVGSTSPY